MKMFKVYDSDEMDHQLVLAKRLFRLHRSLEPFGLKAAILAITSR